MAAAHLMMAMTRGGLMRTTTTATSTTTAAAMLSRFWAPGRLMLGSVSHFSSLQSTPSDSNNINNSSGDRNHLNVERISLSYYAPEPPAPISEQVLLFITFFVWDVDVALMISDLLQKSGSISFASS